MTMDTAIRPIVFVGHTALLGGAELYLRDVVVNLSRPCRVLLYEDGPLAEALRRQDVCTHIVAAPEALASVRKGSGLATSLVAASRLPGFFLRLRRAMAGAGAIYVNSQKSLVTAAPVGWSLRVPVIWNVHDIMTSDHFGSTTLRAASWIAKRFVTRLVANSVATRDSLIALGIPADKIDIVYNGIPDGRERDPQDEVDAFRAELGLDPSRWTVGVFGRLAEWKGQHVLLEAMQDMPDVQAVLVGAALFPSDELYEARLRTQVADAGMSDRVRFLGFRSDVSRLMHICDAIAHTSISPEPFGRVIVEAMVNRVSVVAARAGGALEIIRPGDTGLLTEPGSAAELAEALRWFRDNPETSRSMAEMAYTDCRTRFSVEAMVHGVEATVEAATGGTMDAATAPTD